MPKTSCVEKQGDFSDCVLTIQRGRRYAEAEKYTFSELQAAVRKRRRMRGLQSLELFLHQLCFVLGRDGYLQIQCPSLSEQLWVFQEGFQGENGEVICCSR